MKRDNCCGWGTTKAATTGKHWADIEVSCQPIETEKKVWKK